MAFVPFKPKGAPAAPAAGAPAVPPGKGKKKPSAFDLMKAAAAAKKS